MRDGVTEPRSIVWLASYPKSGSTWLRAQLTALLQDGPVDIDRLIGGALAQDRHAFGDSTGLDPSELKPGQLAYYRSIFHLQLASRHSRPLFVKVHDRFSGGDAGGGPFPAAASAGVVYIARSPLDVAVSLAHHNGETIDNAIMRMNDEAAVLNARRGGWNSFLPAELGGWSTHVNGWTGQLEIPLLLVRYEDMINDPASCLARVAKFSGLEVDVARIADAVARSGFSVLKQAEIERGFAERPVNMGRFFREGRAGSWREALRPDQVEHLLRDHAATMSRLAMRT